MPRVSLGGKCREREVGGYASISLKEPRELANYYLKMAKHGIDPINTQANLNREVIRPKNTLASIAEADFEAKRSQRMMASTPAGSACCNCICCQSWAT